MIKINPFAVLLMSVVVLSGCNISSSSATRSMSDQQIKLKAQNTVYLQADDQISTCDEYYKDPETGEPSINCAENTTVTFNVNMLTGSVVFA